MSDLSDLLPNLDFTVSAAAELSLGSATTEKQLATQNHRIERYAPRSIKYLIGLALTTLNSVIVQYITDEPSAGRYLHVRRIHLDSANPNQVAIPTGINIFLIATPGSGAGPEASGTTPNLLSSAVVLWRWTSLPIDQTFSRGSMRVDHPEKLYLVGVNNGATPAQLSGNLQTTTHSVDEFSDPTMVRTLLDSFRG